MLLPHPQLLLLFKLLRLAFKPELLFLVTVLLLGDKLGVLVDSNAESSTSEPDELVIKLLFLLVSGLWLNILFSLLIFSFSSCFLAETTDGWLDLFSGWKRLPVR